MSVVIIEGARSWTRKANGDKPAAEVIDVQFSTKTREAREGVKGHFSKLGSIEGMKLADVEIGVPYEADMESREFKGVVSWKLYDLVKLPASQPKGGN